MSDHYVFHRHNLYRQPPSSRRFLWTPAPSPTSTYARYLHSYYEYPPLSRFSGCGPTRASQDIESFAIDYYDYDRYHKRYENVIPPRYPYKLYPGARYMGAAFPGASYMGRYYNRLVY